MVKISVITVAYNSAATIGCTLDSVANQTYENVQHVVIDGQSTDDTLRLIRCKGTPVKLVSESDSGMYDAMNKGIALADGDVIGTLNADDQYFDASVLEEVASVFRDPAIDACYGDLVYVDRSTASRIERYWKACEFRQGLFSDGWCPPHPTFFVRKGIYQKYGGFDLSYKLAADVELMMRFLERHGITAKYVPRLWVKMRVGGTSNKSLRNILQQNLYIARAARQHQVPFNPATFFVRKLISRSRQRFARPA